MAHPNAELIRNHVAALSRGDVATAMRDYSENFVLYYPGRNPLSGTYRGKPALLAFFEKVMKITGGTFHVEVHDILANDEHAVLLGRLHARHDDKTLAWDAIDVYHIQNGSITEHWVHEADQASVDEFWS